MSEMEQRVNGGPAFPFSAAMIGFASWNSLGMSLRDWFAGQALAISYCRFMPSADPTPEDLALQAYFIADAMLEARAARTMEDGKDTRDADIAILLAQIDAAREMDGQLSDDPEDIALIEQIRDGWKARSAEAA